MANEFKVKKGLVVNGSGSVILDIQGSQGQLFSVTDQLSGSLFSVNDISGIPILGVSSDDSVRMGTYTQEAIIVSGSSTRHGFNQTSRHTFTGSVFISASLSVSGTLSVTSGITGSLFGTASWSNNAVTSSYVLNAVSSSFALTASSADNFLVRQSITSSTALITGTLTAQTLVVSTISSSIVYSSGSNIFGNSTSNSQTFTGSVNITGSLNLTGRATLNDLTGSLFGTASWAQNFLTSSVTSASYATTASYALTASYANNITISGSINSVDYIDFDTSSTFVNIPGRLGWDLGENNLQLGMYGGNVQLSVGNQLYQYVYNSETSSLSKGQVVFISGSQGNQIAVKLASALAEYGSANTLGLVAETINSGQSGWILTDGELTKLNTIGLVAGKLIYLGTTPGTYTQTAPTAPNHGVRLGYAERIDATVGSLYIKIDNGYEIGELHDVIDNTTASSYGDILTKSGSVWINSKSLTGSYNLTGSIVVTGSISLNSTLNTSTTITSVVGSNTILTQATGSYTSAFYKYSVSSGSNSRAGEVVAVWNGTAVQYTDYSTVDIGNTATLSTTASLSGGNILLTAQTSLAGWTIKALATYI